jgi:uncharacterized membrane protein YphA (DoxX/SURF4 family)
LRDGGVAAGSSARSSTLSPTVKFGHIPTRLATGAFVFHSGWEKWHGDEATANAIHGFAVGAYPMLQGLAPTRFLKLLAVGEMAVGAVLVLPIIPAAKAGAALTGFSGALLGLYARTPGMRKPNSIWPTQQGTAISKDIWMLGIGLGLIADGLAERRSS